MEKITSLSSHSRKQRKKRRKKKITTITVLPFVIRYFTVHLCDITIKIEMFRWSRTRSTSLRTGTRDHQSRILSTLFAVAVQTHFHWTALREAENWNGQRILKTLVCLFIEIHSARHDIRAINIAGSSWPVSKIDRLSMSAHAIAAD